MLTWFLGSLRFASLLDFLSRAGDFVSILLAGLQCLWWP